MGKIEAVSMSASLVKSRQITPQRILLNNTFVLLLFSIFLCFSSRCCCLLFIFFFVCWILRILPHQLHSVSQSGHKYEKRVLTSVYIPYKVLVVHVYCGTKRKTNKIKKKKERKKA